MVHPNTEFMHRYSAALQAGQVVEALPFYAEDLVLHIPGRGPHAGTTRGQDASPSSVVSADPSRNAPSAR